MGLSHVCEHILDVVVVFYFFNQFFYFFLLFGAEFFQLPVRDALESSRYELESFFFDIFLD